MTKILGMGNALVDVLARIDNEDLLRDLNFPKGSMQLIDNEKRKIIFEKINPCNPELATGGSASNTSLALAKMGVKAGFIGKVGNDSYGNFYVDEIQKSGVVPHFISKNAPSGTAMTLITPDGERTFGTYLGVSSELSEADLNPEVFRVYNQLYVEGYLVQNYALIKAAMQMAKKMNLSIAIDLASFNIVKSNLDFFQQLISEFVDIVFANEEEAKELTGKPAEEAVKIIGSQARIAVVKIGPKGSLIKKGKEEIHVPAYPSDLVDATAAGDFYAAGFLYGLNCGAEMEKCGKIGSLLASYVIRTIGTKLPEETWTEIRKKAQEILN